MNDNRCSDNNSSKENSSTRKIEFTVQQADQINRDARKAVADEIKKKK
jgi:hypothetical protein